MEHEVFVPFPVGDVRRVLSDPARVARCVPGLQQDAADASDATVAGRLRLRIGGSTITYRGSLRLTERDGSFELSGEGAEVRGNGTVTLALTALAEAVPGGTRLTCAARVDCGGRLAEFDAKTTQTTARRLLERVAVALAEELRRDADGSPDADTAETGPQVPLREEPGDGPDLDAIEAIDAMDDLDDEDEEDDDEDDAPPAEAAHARRTMIGRSAEEVDHAPPRGRYAPVPAPEAASATAAALRWAAPAAAVALASAVVVGRALRRRR
ncbi:SRPBCC domain-containing protein [Streptomyces syringium]|uniref:SRPBCC domain-containing protein n=1 Tax=Streptomyces syringium TaxID=76729 RepID=UPI003455A671